MTGLAAVLASGQPASTLAVVASDVSRSQSGLAPAGTVTTTAPPLTTATGGVAPYTYLWTRQSGSVAFNVLSATDQNPVWEGVVSDGPGQQAVWRVTVTDSVSATAFTDINVELIWTQTS